MRLFAKTLPAAIAWLTLSSSATAAVIHYAAREIPIPSNFAGVSVDLEEGAPPSNDLDGVPNGDANFYYGGANITNDADVADPEATWQPVRTGTGNTDPVANLVFGTPVDASSTYDTTPDPPAFGSSATHITGGGLPGFVSGTSAYIGFSMIPNDGGGPWYGWMRVTLYNDGPGPTGTPGIIHEWAYDNTGAPILVGAIPEPSSAALALLGLGTFALRRRRS